ncbi:hypothetical protein QAD02_011807 [Eretmocerus hayati]|uniref:Uncharacterized protein n=1 Tax=Eretmocerus hayati TaxID=131215 RepID=A0ACC2NZ12_9HYME|nr:hypothetical protein QAD02_011807 [Eretmocerus hayati]
MAYHRDSEKSFHLAVAEYGNSRLPNGPIVTTADGKIQGSILKSVYGPEYLAFTRIPYGKPPIGPLRFQAPQPAAKWEGVLDGSKQGFFPLHCVPDSDCPEVGGSEDCLTVNVYTKSIDSCRKKPVIFFVPGAGFLYASNHEGSCRYDYLITQNIVLVSVNYRQGPLGFLNLGHELASGNQGIRDVILALKWTRRNIEAFGGDPENITIMGSSAGSYTCHLLTLIPSTKGIAHADDMSYVLYFTYMRIKMGEEVYPQERTLDRIVSEKLVRMFYNFAAFGNPTPQTDDTYLTTSRAFYDKIKEVYRV